MSTWGDCFLRYSKHLEVMLYLSLVEQLFYMHSNIFKYKKSTRDVRQFMSYQVPADYARNSRCHRSFVINSFGIDPFSLELAVSAFVLHVLKKNMCLEDQSFLMFTCCLQRHLD